METLTFSNIESSNSIVCGGCRPPTSSTNPTLSTCIRGLSANPGTSHTVGPGIIQNFQEDSEFLTMMHRVICPSLALLAEVPKIRLENFPSLSNIISSFLASRSVSPSIITLVLGVSLALAKDSAWWKEFGVAIGIYRDRKWTHNSLSASVKVQNITYSATYITADCASDTTPFACTTSSYP